MNRLILYGVYIAEFPFLESDKGKLRPVVVVSEAVGKHGIVAVVPVSSQPDKQAVDVTLNSWRDAGLLKPSVARVHRLTTIIQSKLGSYLGELTIDENKQLKESMRRFLIL